MYPVPVAPPVPVPNLVDPATIAAWPDRLTPALGGPHAAAGPDLLGGLLSGAEHKNGWQLAEVNGDVAPYCIQYLINRARWSVAEARAALCDHMQARLGDPQAVGGSSTKPRS